MLFFLIQNVFCNRIYLTSGIRECPETFLPIEMSANPSFFIDELRGAGFYISNKIRQTDIRLHADQYVSVVRHNEDRKHFLATIGDDP